MIKKAFLLIVAFLTLCAVPSAAQHLDGRWTVFPIACDGISKAVDTPLGIYTLSGNTLSRLDYASGQSRVFVNNRDLSDMTQISGLYYNYSRNFLAVAYASGNIDLIYDDGRVVCLSQIRDAVLKTKHTINNITFDGDDIYVAMPFGFVVIDAADRKLKEKGELAFNTDHAIHLGGSLMVKNGNLTYFAADGAFRNAAASFTKVANIGSFAVYPIGNNTLVWRNSSKNLIKRVYNMETYANASDVTVAKNLTAALLPAADGVVGYSATEVFFLNNAGELSTLSIPADYQNCAVVAAAGPESVWFKKNGAIHRLNLRADTPQALMTVEAPSGATVRQPVIMKWNKAGTRLYVSNRTCNFNLEDWGDNYDKPSYLDVIEDGSISDFAVHNASRYSGKIADLLRDSGTDRLGGATRFVVDPDDDDIIYQSNNGLGIAMIKDNSIAAVSNKQTNVCGTNWWMNRTMGVDIDSEGNLWMFVGYAENGDNSIGILPASLRQKIGEVKKADWVAVTGAKAFGDDWHWERDMTTLFCTRSGVKFFAVGSRDAGLVVYDDGGQPLNPAVHRSKHYQFYIDQDLNRNELTFTNDFVEDHDGAVWIATDHGVCVVPDPTADLGDTDLKAVRPVMKRTDGAHKDEYLLFSEFIYSISVDQLNRKWIATDRNGVYLVSADGSKILAHFNTENSPLPSNLVYSISCSPTSTKVYFGTSVGVVEFDYDNPAGADSYDNVDVYPNPVRPDYTGWITISGLMNNSYVAITDQYGNEVYTAFSEGGTLVWDGCDKDGMRLGLGIYSVYAAQQSADIRAAGPVAKIFVVK